MDEDLKTINSGQKNFNVVKGIVKKSCLSIVNS